jgi:hypothetical protein
MTRCNTKKSYNISGRDAKEAASWLGMGYHDVLLYMSNGLNGGHCDGRTITVGRK